MALSPIRLSCLSMNVERRSESEHKKSFSCSYVDGLYDQINLRLKQRPPRVSMNPLLASVVRMDPEIRGSRDSDSLMVLLFLNSTKEFLDLSISSIFLSLLSCSKT